MNILIHVGGFYSDKWGDDLLEEIAREVTDSKLFESLEELVA